jgi:cystathionine gamma-synthase
MKLERMKLETLAIHAGRMPDPATGAVREPIHLSTTFERAPDGSYPRGFSYTRAGNPNRASLETAVAAIEGGAAAVAYASGSAATLAAFSLATPGGRIVCSSDCYHGSLRQLRELLPRWGVAVEFVDTTDLPAVRAALARPASLLWLETPSNPLLKVSDIAALAGLAHAGGALLGCDNTFATPVLQRPLELGADLVMHSSTKYLGGHGDVMGGALVLRDVGLLGRLQEFQSCGGGVPSPFDCWLVLRSLATLPLRVRAQAVNAHAVATFLSAHPGVENVHYPGLATHPGHTLASRQMQGGYGAVVSFTVPGGALQALDVVARATVFTRATSLGGLESLIEHRASIEGPESTTPANLIRLSVGLEHIDDLTADLDQSLRR